MKGTMTTAELAKAIGVSTDTILRRAKQSLGCTFNQRVSASFTFDEVKVIIDAIRKDPLSRLTKEQLKRINSIEMDSTANSAPATANSAPATANSAPATANNLKVELKGGANNPLHKNFFPKDAEELDLAVELSRYIDAVTTYIQAKRKLNEVRSELKLIE